MFRAHWFGFHCLQALEEAKEVHAKAEAEEPVEAPPDISDVPEDAASMTVAQLQVIASAT